MPKSVRYALAVFAALWLVGIAIAGIDDHHGVDSAKVPLPILRVEDIGFSGATRLVVECATDVSVEVGKDHGGSSLTEVTVWGRPKIGRCHPLLAVPVTAGPKIIDGATSHVVDLS